MKLLQSALRSLFSEPSPVDAHERSRAQARKLGAELGVCFEALPDGGMNVWPPKECQSDPFEADHYACNWSEALERVQAYAAARGRDLPACLKALSPRVRALLNDSLCNDDASNDDDMQAHWQAEFGLNADQARAAMAYRARCLVDVFYRPFSETLDTV